MKKITILALGAVALMASCKKSSDSSSCEVSVTAIAGSYKISKIEVVTAGIASDVTSTFLDACERDDIYTLKADKTVSYQDAGTVCSSNGTGTGSWDIVSGKLTLNVTGTGTDFANATVSNNCSSIVVEESAGNGSIRTTLAKQ
jgi:hypothetical protein